MAGSEEGLAMIRLAIVLTDDEGKALFKDARSQRRHPREQAAILIVERLRTLGLLTAPDVVRPLVSTATDNCEKEQGGA